MRLFFTKFVKLDPDPEPHSFYLLYPDPHSEKLLDPDPKKMNADPLPWFRLYLILKFLNVYVVCKPIRFFCGSQVFRSKKDPNPDTNPSKQNLEAGSDHWFLRWSMLRHCCLYTGMVFTGLGRLVVSPLRFSWRRICDTAPPGPQLDQTRTWAIKEKYRFGERSLGYFILKHGKRI